MRWPWSKKPEEEARQVEFINPVTGQVWDAADDLGTGLVAGLETASGALGRAISAGDVTGPGAAWFPPSVMARIGRLLVEQGEAVYQPVGDRLDEAASYVILSGGDYQLTFRDIGRQGVTRRVSRSRVFNPRWNYDLSTQRGRSALSNARQLKYWAARLERSIAQEADAPTALLVPIPKGTEEQVTALAENVATLRGKVGLVETQMASYDAQSRAAAPLSDYAQKRIGPAIPEGSLAAQVQAYNEVLAACGYPPSLSRIDGDAGAMRESFRIFLHLTVKPVAKLIEESAQRIGRPIRIDFTPLGAADVAGKARAFGAFRKAGLSMEESKRAVGLD